MSEIERMLIELDNDGPLAEVARLLDLACTCESDPCCRCEAHQLDPPSKCACGHTAVMHGDGPRPRVGDRCNCLVSLVLDCPCPGYTPKDAS